jgi:transposase
MRLHGNAALTLKQRERMVRRGVDDGWSLTKAAEAAEVSDRTCSKWVMRYRARDKAITRSLVIAAPRRQPHERADRAAAHRAAPPAVRCAQTRRSA